MAQSDGEARTNGREDGAAETPGGGAASGAGPRDREPARGGNGRDPGPSADLIDDAIRLVDSLQRKLIIAGVRKGVSTVASPPPRTGDVWEQAIREEQAPPEPALDRLAGVVRTAAPEVAGHLGRAGMALFGAVQESWRIASDEFERQRREREEREEREARERREREARESDNARGREITESTQE
ncbi:hypothetical protein O4J56_26130 [Nocardiopsis sp. RSe5-2]|uniref:YbaB/EbfC family DNA-binding protein n=1 Tax=Nocardiopsis endophytica TaxID=3018445 RepID=A0ABT4UB32_9ACTN|nr:hypothetical protein [Nocardiopsis endophytica]MDA2814153.1 hypothetical protein [Nocardiopsis endophytica]